MSRTLSNANIVAVVHPLNDDHYLEKGTQEHKNEGFMEITSSVFDCILSDAKRKFTDENTDKPVTVLSPYKH
jgi:hypothetical protein